MKLNLIQWFCYISMTVLISVIIWASLDKNLWEGGKLILAEPWGVATFVDLYISFTLICIFMGYLENSWAKGIILMIATYFLGSLIPLAYILIRFKKIKQLVSFEGEKIK
jgi:hypothetical protein